MTTLTPEERAAVDEIRRLRSIPARTLLCAASWTDTLLRIIDRLTTRPTQTLRPNLSTPGSRDFWTSVHRVADEVRQWPAWMRGECERGTPSAPPQDPFAEIVAILRRAATEDGDGCLAQPHPVAQAAIANRCRLSTKGPTAS
jgi:hypothetical protein